MWFFNGVLELNDINEVMILDSNETKVIYIDDANKEEFGN